MTKIVKKIAVKRDSIRSAAVKKVAKEFQVTKEYVYGCINGSMKNGIAEDIVKDYNFRYNEAKKVLGL